MLLRPIAQSRLLLLWLPLLWACATPAPLSEPEHFARARADLEQMFSGQQPLEGPLGFYEAVARAVKYNLDQRLELMQQALADERVVGARLDLLPRLVAKSEYFGRSNELASRSESFFTGTESLEASISSARHGLRGDLTLAWNLLDFGVSYVRASQESNRALIARERRAKVVQDLMLEVRRSYWRAVGAERLIPQIDRLLVEVGTALDDSESLEHEGLLDPLEALAYQRALIDKALELGRMRRRLEVARIELASLVNLSPGSALELAAHDVDELELPRLDPAMAELEVAALAARPELREEAYQERIGHLEVRRAMLSALPGLELRFGRNQDDNAFLVHDDWLSYSALLSKNLIEIVTAPQRIGLARAGLQVTEMRRLATGMAVLAQVHVAHQDFLASQDAVQFSRRAREVESRIHEVTRERVEAESQSELDLIHRDASRLVSEMSHYVEYADLQAAYGRLLNSVGVLPPLGEDDVEDIAVLTERIRGALQDWGRRVGPPGPGQVTSGG